MKKGCQTFKRVFAVLKKTKNKKRLRAAMHGVTKNVTGTSKSCLRGGAVENF